ncbi:hypothetical protein JET14_13165 [Martelella lutilitoris]|uniref:Holin n=1 Tax=Martelella lutilitoris TaxID=2583532 RepID=A0A7T7HHK5_9HYPH|nr:hypothetical protein [Martelella lutilitoris]QQM29277.1 hypothetical protein JET14_13165 [Martelella lutilitoris]
MQWLLKWLTGDVAGALQRAYEAKLNAQNDKDRIQAEVTIDALNQQASVIKEGMAHRMFWVAWSIAAIPTAAWFGWGVLDTLLNGALPDVAELPPQLKEYADTVWQNIFFTGAGVAAAEKIASRMGRR